MATNIKLLSYDLAEEGYEVFAAYNGRQALQVAKATHPDVILLDIVMPGMDGIEVCRKLKAHHELRCIPVIMVSGMHGEEDVINGLDAGAQDYVASAGIGADSGSSFGSGAAPPALGDVDPGQGGDAARLEESGGHRVARQHLAGRD